MQPPYFLFDEDKTTVEIALKRADAALAPLRDQLAVHPVYDSLRSVEDVRVFMENHVYAVWDFMALLKALQRHLTCVDSHWSPVGSGSTRRLINEMVLEEESDEINGIPISHFEVYCNGMREAGADLHFIDDFLAQIANGTAMETAFAESNVPLGARAFVRTTFKMIASGKPHVIAAAFTFGREQAIPRIFQAMLDAIPGAGDQLQTLKLYLERHIELDGNAHGPKAIAMLSSLCGTDAQKWHEAIDAAREALTARDAFWTAITGEITKTRVANMSCTAVDHQPAFAMGTGTAWFGYAAAE
jgi:pyrroloquinoline quinone (PQQ) biosynthesis protein C